MVAHPMLDIEGNGRSEVATPMSELPQRKKPGFRILTWHGRTAGMMGCPARPVKNCPAGDRTYKEKLFLPGFLSLGGEMTFAVDSSMQRLPYLSEEIW